MKNFSKIKYLLLLVIAFLSCQNKMSLYNLDFEYGIKSKESGWEGDFELSKDTKQGKYSALIQNDSGKEQYILFFIPDNYYGRDIRVTGYLKTEEADSASFVMMANTIKDDKIIKGTTEWTKYELSVQLDTTSNMWMWVGIAINNGKIWADDIKITVDGKDINKEIKRYKAKDDKGYDDGSKIEFPELNETLITNLELLGKLWGFLKYHHPVIAQGQYNWDYELFRMLPAYLKATNNVERDKLLLKWINRYGRTPEYKTCAEPDSGAYIKPDFSWIHKYNMNGKLIEKINKIYAGRNQGQHYYIRRMPNVCNPEFTNEDPYFTKPYSDAGFRLLALYRYWNMINYFFPYKYMTDKDWQDILKDYIPVFLNVKTKLDYELAALKISGEVNDTHAQLYGKDIDRYKGEYYSFVNVNFIEEKLVVTGFKNDSLATVTDLKRGDIITHINNKAIDSLVYEKWDYYPASNIPTKLRIMAGDLLRSTNKSMYINYISGGTPKSTEISLYPSSSNKKNADKKGYKIIDKNIGYINPGLLKKEDIKIIKDTFKYTDGIIIDMRHYPRTTLPVSYFVTEPTSFVKYTRIDINNPGRFDFFDKEVIKPDTTYTYKNKVVAIVNDNTISAGEYQTMALQTGVNTTVIGSQTAGADGNVSEIILPGNLKTYISGIGIYYPNETPTQRIGIVPDIEVKPTIKGIKEGRDELLEKAVEVIKKEDSENL